MNAIRFPTLWKYALRQTRRRPARSALTLLGIIIGVATIVAVSLTTQATRTTYRAMFESLTGRASLEVVSDGQKGFDAGVVARLDSLSAIAHAVPVIQAPAAMLTKAGPAPVMVLGIDGQRDRAARDYVLREGANVGTEPGVTIGADFAASHGLSVGQSVRLLTSTGLITTSVVGILESHGAARFNGGAVLFMPLSEAQRRFGLTGKINGVHLVLAKSVDIDQAKPQVLAQLPDGLTVQTPSERGQLVRDSLLNTEQILAVLSVVSLVAGSFVILNAFQMNLGERRRQLAILRALGATRQQITRLLLREAVVYGATGTVLGIGAGIGISVALIRGMEQLLGATIPDLNVTAEPLLLALCLGPGMTLAATYVPARRAGRRLPIDDLLNKHRFDEPRFPRWPCIVGLVLIIACLLIDTAFINRWISPTLGRSLLPVATVSVLVGCVLALPLVLPVLMRLVTRLLKPLLGKEGSMAFRQLQRQRYRTSLTAGALMLAVLIMIGPGNEIKSSLGNLDAWFENVASADFFVQGTNPDVAFALTPVSLPESLLDEIAALEGVADVDAGNWFPARVNRRAVLLIAYTYSRDQPQRLNPARNSPADIMERLRGGDVVVGTSLAQRLGLGVGDKIDLDTTQGRRTFRVAGKCHQYHAGGMTVHMQRRVAQGLFELGGFHFAAITANKGQAAALASQLRSFCDQRGLLLHSYEGLRNEMDERISGTIGFLWVLMALVFIVASLGIVNTLTMNVLEQTRELGVLRAIGMRRGQIRKMIFSQALAIGLISLIPGVLLGLGLAYMMHLPAESLTGHRLDFRIHFSLIGVASGLALAVAVVASLIPARYAARLHIIRAIHYE